VTLAQLHKELGAALSPAPKKETLRFLLRHPSIGRFIPGARPQRGGGAPYYYNRSDVRAFFASRVQGGGAK